MTELKKVLNKAENSGREEDDVLGHLSPGEVVLPKEFVTPEVSQILEKIFSEAGASLGRYTVGHEENSINPKTDLSEFFSFRKLLGKISPLFDAATGGRGGALGSALTVLAPGIGTALGTGLGLAEGAGASTVGNALVGAGIGGLTGGGRGALLGAIGGGITPNLGDIASGLGDATGIHLGNIFGDASGASGNVSGVVPTSASAAGEGFAPTTNAPIAAAANATPSGVDSSSWLQDPTLGSQASSALSPNVGSGTVGTPSFASNLSSPVADAIAGTGASSAGNAAAAAPNSLESFASNPSASSAWNVIKSNPGAALNAAGIVGSAIRGNQTMPGEKEIKNIAGKLNTQGEAMQNYLSTGTLPPGLQASINQASEAAKATIRSQYASRGMSGSSAEQQDLQSVDQRAQAQGAQTALQLLQTGINETGMAANLYNTMLGRAMESDEQLSSAISGFASSLAGGNPSAHAA